MEIYPNTTAYVKFTHIRSSNAERSEKWLPGGRDEPHSFMSFIHSLTFVDGLAILEFVHAH
jgi:hypothetical protein